MVLFKIKKFLLKIFRLLVDEDLAHSNLLSERCSHSACYHPKEKVMFMFGGCTSTYTAFNDLWLFDLVKI